MSVDQPLQGKILVITGGASGIGLSVAKQAHALGSKILVADLKKTSDFELFQNDTDNERLLYVKADVTNWADLNKLFDLCEDKWNDVPDAYAICAGLFEPSFSNFWDDPEQESGYLQVDVNVNHPIKLTRLAIRKSLGRGKRASVCIISSLAGISGVISAPLYTATKHAIVGFVKSLKDTEDMTGVKVTALCPGAVFTPLFDAAKIQQYSVFQENSLTPDTCATHLLDLLQKKEYPCGSMLELTTVRSRLIPDWNISKPEGVAPEKELAPGEWNQNLLAPVMRVLEREKSR